MTACTTARRLATIALLMALGAAAGACSSTGPGYFERVGGSLRAAIAPPERKPPRERTRAELNEIPYATIAVSLRDVRAIVVARAENRGTLDYRDSAGRAIRMRSGALAGTEGLGIDLAAVRHAQDDPVAYPMPLADWPDSVFREYQYRVRHAPQYGITLACAHQVLARETIEIFEIGFDVVRVSEVCTNQARQVVNTYWVEPETGFIWKSEQWAGPLIGHLTIEIVRPYAG